MKVLRLSPSQGLALLSLLVIVLQLGGCVVSPRLDSGDKPSVAGKTFVITGASSGFGRGVALRLATLQGNVVLAARRTEVLEQLAAQIHEVGGSALVVTTDVSRPDEVLALAQAAISASAKLTCGLTMQRSGRSGASKMFQSRTMRGS